MWLSTDHRLSRRLLPGIVAPSVCFCWDWCCRQLFERVPVGPIGAHLTLTHQMWDVAAEVVLGPHLEKWIVHNERDQTVSCQHIATLHCCMPAHCLQAGELVHHRRFPALPASLLRPPWVGRPLPAGG